MSPDSRINRKSSGAPTKGTVLLRQLVDDTRALNSAISIISQKIKHLVRNEKILGRNLIVLNKKLAKMQETGGSTKTVTGKASVDTSEFSALLKEQNQKIDAIETELNTLKKDFVTKSQLKELKFVIDSINPLSFLTVEQAKKLIDERIAKQKKK